MPHPHEGSKNFLQSLAANAVWWLIAGGALSSVFSWLAQLPDVLRGALFAFGGLLLLLGGAVAVFRFARRTDIETRAGTVDSAPLVSFHTFSMNPSPEITRERKRELLNELLTEALGLPEDMPPDAANVWRAFRSNGLRIVEKLYGRSSQHYNDFAEVVLISPAIRMDVRADWQRGRTWYVNCIKRMLKEIELFGE